MQSPPIKRLGLCEVCANVEAKYTCPKCEVKTCSLRCLNIHKKELDCTGIRDKTRFIPIRDMTTLDFNSDYTFLEECTRYVADRKRDNRKRHTRYNKTLPTHLFKLRGAAQERGTQLRFLLALFSRHATNTTFYEWKTHVIRWRVQWVFTNAGNVTFSDARCDERQTLLELLSKYVVDVDVVAPTAATEQPPLVAASQLVATEAAEKDELLQRGRAMHKALEFYRARGIAQMRVLLKAEGIKRSRTRFWELDMRQTLRANLAGKTIVEFPVVYVVYDDVVKEFDVIDSDEDVARETELYQLEMKTATAPLQRHSRHNDVDDIDAAKTDISNVDDNMRELQLKRRRDERRAKRARQAKKAPTNLLFSNGNDIGTLAASGATSTTSDEEDESDGDNEDGNETEEEVKANTKFSDQHTKKATVRRAAVNDDDDDEYEDVAEDETKRARLSGDGQLL